MIFASTAIVQQNPDAVRRFLRGWFEFVAFMKSAQGRERAARREGDGLYARRGRSHVRHADGPKFSTDGKFNPQALKTLRDSFIDMKSNVDPSIDMSKFYTTEFLPKA